MKRSISQIMVLILALTAFVSNSFVGDMVVCDMSSSGNIMTMDHHMAGHDMSDHHMPDHDMSGGHGQMQSSHSEPSHTAMPHMSAHSQMEDCCDTECKCQHGVCSTLAIIQQVAFSQKLSNVNQAVIAGVNFPPSVTPPSLFRPPIA